MGYTIDIYPRIPYHKVSVQSQPSLLAHCPWPLLSPVYSLHKGQWHGTLKYIFFDQGLNKQLSKQSRPRWFETPSRSLWRHCNANNSPRLLDWLWANRLIAQGRVKQFRRKWIKSNEYITTTNQIKTKHNRTCSYSIGYTACIYTGIPYHKASVQRQPSLLAHCPWPLLSPSICHHYHSSVHTHCLP